MSPGGYEILCFPKARFSTIGMGKPAGSRRPMYGLIEVGVTNARRMVRSLRKKDAGQSFTAGIVKTVADCVRRNPRVHAIEEGGS
jgi:hypothetical protein